MLAPTTLFVAPLLLNLVMNNLSAFSDITSSSYFNEFDK